MSVCDDIIVVSDTTQGYSVFRSTEDNRVLVKGFPRSIEYTDKCVRVAPPIDVESFKVYKCLEGTIIRVFYHNNKWYTATSSRLDAFKSRWAAKKTTFGQTFATKLRAYASGDIDTIDDDVKFLETFYEKHLTDKTRRYLFLLSPSEEERIVCSAQTVFIGAEDPETHVVDFDAVIELANDLDNLETFPKPQRVHGLKTNDDVAEFVCNKTHFSLEQGVVLFRYTHDCELESIKVMSDEYYDRFTLRNNVPSLKFRYLQLRSRQFDLDLFFELYPHMLQESIVIEQHIYELCKKLHRLYVDIYIAKIVNDSVCTNDEANALKFIHSVYLQSRRRTTAQRINDILTESNPSKLNRLLKEVIRTKHTVT